MRPAGDLMRTKEARTTADGTMPDEALVGRKSEEDGVELLVLRHPPVNALSAAVLAELESGLAALDTPSTRCVVVTGDGQYFSAGADLKELAGIGPEGASGLVARGQ